MATAPGALWGGGGAGSNQFGSFGTGMPGIVPTFGSGFNFGPGNFGPAQAGGVTYNSQTRKSGYSPVQTMFPQFTQSYYDYLNSQIGQGLPGFNLSTLLPSSGQATAPGALNAPLTNVLQQLQSFYSGGASSVPGASTLTSMANTGNPTDVGPAWQAMVAAQQQNIAQNQANLREQFASTGSLAGTPFAGAMGNFMSQTTADQNALLAQMQQQASESAAGRALQASTALNQGAMGLGTTLQGLDQQAIQNMLQEFNYTLPQNNPLNNIMFSAATTFPPTVQTGKGTGASSILGDLGGLISMIPGIGTGIGSLMQLFGGGGGGGGGSMAVSPSALDMNPTWNSTLGGLGGF